MTKTPIAERIVKLLWPDYTVETKDLGPRAGHPIVTYISYKDSAVEVFDPENAHKDWNLIQDELNDLGLGDAWVEQLEKNGFEFTLYSGERPSFDTFLISLEDKCVAAEQVLREHLSTDLRDAVMGKLGDNWELGQLSSTSKTFHVRRIKDDGTRGEFKRVENPNQHSADLIAMGLLILEGLDFE